jgi:hypothetical protein
MRISVTSVQSTNWLVKTHLLKVAFAKVWAEGVFQFRQREVDGTGDGAECYFIWFSYIHNKDILSMSLVKCVGPQVSVAHIVRLLGNWLELFVRDDRFPSPCTPLGRLVSVSKRDGAEGRNGSESGGRSDERCDSPRGDCSRSSNSPKGHDSSGCSGCHLD